MDDQKQNVPKENPSDAPAQSPTPDQAPAHEGEGEKSAPGADSDK